jgi:hypothetical protein
MIQYQANDLFQLQTELVDAKVDIAVSKASDRIIDRIENLSTEVRTEVHALKHDIGDRLTAVETRLGMRNAARKQLRSRFIDYAFKAGWLILATIFAALFLYHKP